MQVGKSGMGMSKHRTSGRSGKSPNLKQYLKREAEKRTIKDRSRILDPKSSVSEVFKK